MCELNNSSRMDLNGKAGWGHIPAQTNKVEDFHYKRHPHFDRCVGRAKAEPAIKPWCQPVSISPILQALWRELGRIDPYIHYPCASNSDQAVDELKEMFNSSTLTVGDLKKALAKMPPPNNWVNAFLSHPDLTRFLALEFYPLKELKANMAVGLVKHIPSVTPPVNERPVRRQIDQPALLKKPAQTKELDKKPANAEVHNRMNLLSEMPGTPETEMENKPEGQVHPIHKSAKAVPSEEGGTELTKIQSFLNDLWLGMVKKDDALPFPQLNKATDANRVLERMLSSSKVTVGDLAEVLRTLQTTHPWVESMLEGSAKRLYMVMHSKPVATHKYTVSGPLLRHLRAHINKPLAAGRVENPKNRNLLPGAKQEEPVRAKRQPQDAHKQEYKNHIQLKDVHHSARKVLNELEAGAANIQKQHAGRQAAQAKADEKQRKYCPLPDRPVGNPQANKKPQGPAKEPRPVMVKKSWKNNRVTKGGGRPFTEVQAETPDGKQLFTAELLNTVPDEVLKANGWSENAISGMKVRRKAHPMSSSALKALGGNNVVSGSQGRYFGEGSFGKVKLARITLPGTSRQEWCVAKKVKITTDQDLKDVLNETRLQAQSGVGPKIYGIADTTNKRGQRQCIIFMEKAKGMEGHTFLHEKKRSMSFSDKVKLAENLSQQVETMHRNNVFHSDMKWANSGVSDSLSTQLLDFGLGCSTRHQYEPSYYGEGPGYSSPEILLGQKNSRGYIDMEKVDVYSLGVMLGKLFGSDDFMRHEWYGKNLYNPETQINRELRRSGISDSRIQLLVEHMVQADPDKRPTMKEVIEKIKRLKAAPAEPVRPYYPAGRAPAPRHCGFADRAVFNNPRPGYVY